MAFNLEDYEPVEERLEKFWKDYPDGRIYTELLESTATRFIVFTSIYRTFADAHPWATGLAFEVISDRGVNATSALENAETSSIGRSLANAGYAAKGKRPSREEMTKVVQHPVPLVVVPEVDAASFASTWEIYGDKKVKEPTQAAQAIALVQAELGAKPVPVAPMCQHGEMQRKIGVNAKGEYSGWVCAANGAPRAEQCPAKWDKK